MTQSTLVAPETANHNPTTARAMTPEQAITPPVDIVETDSGLVLLADVPGVKQDDLEIGIHQGVLTIRGTISHVTTASTTQPDDQTRSVYRRFKLSETIDPDRIEAELKHGVLRLDLPKVETAKPKKITVTTG